MGNKSPSFCSSVFLSLVLLHLALAQEHHHVAVETNMTVDAAHMAQGHHGHGALSADDIKLYNMPSYFSHPEHAATMYAHIGIMVLAWAVALPLGMHDLGALSLLLLTLLL